jgi:hypothetical protein
MNYSNKEDYDCEFKRSRGDGNLELQQILDRLNDWNIFILLQRARWVYFKQRMRLPRPVIFSLVCSVIMFALLSIFPSRPIVIPIVIEAGLSGALLFIGGKNAISKSIR